MHLLQSGGVQPSSPYATPLLNNPAIFGLLSWGGGTLDAGVWACGGGGGGGGMGAPGFALSFFNSSSNSVIFSFSTWETRRSLLIVFTNLSLISFRYSISFLNLANNFVKSSIGFLRVSGMKLPPNLPPYI